MFVKGTSVKPSSRDVMHPNSQFKSLLSDNNKFAIDLNGILERIKYSNNNSLNIECCFNI